MAITIFRVPKATHPPDSILEDRVALGLGHLLKALLCGSLPKQSASLSEHQQFHSIQGYTKYCTKYPSSIKSPKTTFLDAPHLAEWQASSPQLTGSLSSGTSAIRAKCPSLHVQPVEGRRAVLGLRPPTLCDQCPKFGF